MYIHKCIIKRKYVKLIFLFEGNAPFSQNDVTSRSAMLGVGKTSHQYWLHKNPNAVCKKTGNRKKKKI